jgi:hypothetical protein
MTRKPWSGFLTGFAVGAAAPEYGKLEADVVISALDEEGAAT